MPDSVHYLIKYVGVISYLINHITRKITISEIFIRYQLIHYLGSLYNGAWILFPPVNLLYAVTLNEENLFFHKWGLIILIYWTLTNIFEIQWTGLDKRKMKRIIWSKFWNTWSVFLCPAKQLGYSCNFLEDNLSLQMWISLESKRRI